MAHRPHIISRNVPENQFRITASLGRKREMQSIKVCVMCDPVKFQELKIVGNQ